VRPVEDYGSRGQDRSGTRWNIVAKDKPVGGGGKKRETIRKILKSAPKNDAAHGRLAGGGGGGDRGVFAGKAGIISHVCGGHGKEKQRNRKEEKGVWGANSGPYFAICEMKKGDVELKSLMQASLSVRAGKKKRDQDAVKGNIEINV